MIMKFDYSFKKLNSEESFEAFGVDFGETIDEIGTGSWVDEPVNKISAITHAYGYSVADFMHDDCEIIGFVNEDGKNILLKDYEFEYCEAR